MLRKLIKINLTFTQPSIWVSVAVSGSPDSRRKTSSHETDDRSQLPREIRRDKVLPLPADRRLRGVRLGLDYSTEEVRGQLLFGRVPVRLPAEVSAHTYCTPGESRRHSGSLLCSAQTFTHIHVVFRQWIQHHLRSVTRHGRWQMRMFLMAVKWLSFQRMLFIFNQQLLYSLSSGCLFSMGIT